MNFLAPAFLWLLAAIPLVVALHFLRNRRRHQVVSALFLWQVATEQANVRRRFALWWLLLLQILAIALLALALAQPVLEGQGVPDRVIVIDASASMAAEDPDGVRLVKAVAGAGELIAEGGRVALIRAGSDAVVLTALTDNQSELAAALAGLEAADARAELDRALELALGLAPEAEVHLFTDEPAPARVGYTWHGVSGAGHNMGISTFELSPQQAFVAITSSWPQPRQVTVRLERDNQPAGSSEVLVPAGGQGNMTFPIEGQAGMFRVQIEPPEGDALALDDVAWAGSRQLSFYMADESESLLRALAAVPGLTQTPAAGTADVIVARSGSPFESFTDASLLSFAQRSSTPEYRLVRDWNQADPILRFVDLMDTQVGLDPDWHPEEQSGVRVLARSADFRPVILAWLENGRQVVQLGFDPAQSDLVYRPAFPTLVANIIDAFRGESSIRLGQALPEGATFAGEPVNFARQPGIYEYPGGQVSASLLSAGESRLPGPGVSAVTEGQPGGAMETAVASDSDLTRWLLLLLPILFAAEWLLWSRRSARPVRA